MGSWPTSVSVRWDWGGWVPGGLTTEPEEMVTGAPRPRAIRTRTQDRCSSSVVSRCSAQMDRLVSTCAWCFFFPKQFTGWVSILEKRSLATLNRFEPGNGGYAGIILGSPVWSKKNQGRMAAWIAQYGGKDIRTDKQRVQYPLSPGTKR